MPALSAEQTKTGRYITAGRTHALVSDWSNAADFAGHELHLRFVNELEECARFQKQRRLYSYRGRRIEDVRKTPQWSAMGPPAAHQAKSGRYNLRGQPALYLCTNEGGVRRELPDQDRPLWVQRFAIPANKLKIADFRTHITSKFTNQVFWFAETPTSGNPGDYRFSQFVAQVVSCRFDGMIVPGVHGDHSIRYNNVVIFNPGNWEHWLGPRPSPYVIEECPIGSEDGEHEVNHRLD